MARAEGRWLRQRDSGSGAGALWGRLSPGGACPLRAPSSHTAGGDAPIFLFELQTGRKAAETTRSLTRSWPGPAHGRAARRCRELWRGREP